MRVRLFCNLFLLFISNSHLSWADSDTILLPEETGSPSLRFGWQDAAVLGFNVVSSCLISGFGARSHRRGRFWGGCLEGALLSGPLIYAGQKMAAYAPFYPNSGLAYIANGVHSLGVSVRDNIAEGISPLDRYQWNWGPIRFSIGRREHNDGLPFNFYVLPLSLIGLVHGLVSAQPNTELSLKLGVPVFDGDLSYVEQFNQAAVSGMAMPNVIFIDDDDDVDRPAVMGHELIHHLNYRGLSFLDQVFERKVYGRRLGKFHLKLGADIGTMGLQVFGLVPHDWRPIEYIPNALDVNTPLAPPPENDKKNDAN